jgi:aspartate/methionine/tyrosine aminotransferase
MASVLTWTDAPAAAGHRSARLRALQASHHAMWNYVTYRDAIAILGLDADAVYPGGSTRLDPAVWADLGWLTCFCGPPTAAVEAMRAAVSAEALNQYTPDLIEPLRDAAAAVVGRARDEDFEVIGAEGAQAAIALTLQACVDPGDEVILSDPGYFHIPSAVLAAGGVPVPVPIGPATGHRLDPDMVAAAITPRTRAICLVDPINPYGVCQTAAELEALDDLAERRGILLVHDITHSPIAIDPAAPDFMSLPALRPSDRSVAAFSVSHCFGMAGARLGFLAGPRRLMRDCLQLKAALTRLNTNLISQHGALAALRDEAYLDTAAAVVRRNLVHLQETLRDVPGARLAVTPQRGLACAVDVSASGATAQEVMVALFARRIAVYPGDGLGESSAATTLRLNLSRPDPWAMEHLRAELPAALAEAVAGRWRAPVAALLDRKGTERAARLAVRVRSGA